MIQVSVRFRPDLAGNAPKLGSSVHGARRLGKPVLTANEVLMHAALRALGTRAVDVGPIAAGG
jgi:hypothetical protein